MNGFLKRDIREFLRSHLASPLRRNRRFEDLHAGEDTYAIRASRIGKLMTAAAAARAMSAYHIH